MSHIWSSLLVHPSLLQFANLALHVPELFCSSGWPQLLWPGNKTGTNTLHKLMFTGLMHLEIPTSGVGGHRQHTMYYSTKYIYNISRHCAPVIKCLLQFRKASSLVMCHE